MSKVFLSLDAEVHERREAPTRSRWFERDADVTCSYDVSFGNMLEMLQLEMIH